MDGSCGDQVVAIEYSFDERLMFSDGSVAAASVDKVLLDAIPGSLNVHRSGHANDRNGTDWWVEHSSGRHLSVDAKVRSKDYAASEDDPKDDLALETWSVVEKQVVGWTRNPDKRSDFILWLWVDTGRWCLVSFPMLCKVFQNKWNEWRTTYKTCKQFTARNGSGYHSECTFVPRREVWAEIYRTFGGGNIVT